MKRKIAIFILIVSLGSPLHADENAVMVEVPGALFTGLYLMPTLALNIGYERALNGYFSWAAD